MSECRADLAHGTFASAEPTADQTSRAFQYALEAEKRAGQIPNLDQSLVQKVNRVGVVGAGTMGTGISIALLNGGLSVTMVDTNTAALEQAKSRIAVALERDVEKGRISPEGLAARLACFGTAGELDALADVDLVIEAVFEDLVVKAKVFAALDQVVRSDAILASNTSTLDLNTIADCVRDPTRVVGLHFFSPANVMKLVEIVRGRSTRADVLATAVALTARIGKVGVVSGVCDGFIGNRIFEEYLRQAWFLLEEGALPQQIDAAMQHWGMAMGPCRTMDLVGQDIGWAIRNRRRIEQPDRPYSHVIDRICELGRFGQKTGKGIYAYHGDRLPEPDPEIEQLIFEHSKSLGLTRRVVGDDEIVARCLLAMINEGAKILEEGIAFRSSDIDVVLLNGYGFRRQRGGAMFQADEIGLAKVVEDLAIFASGRHGWALEPASSLLAAARRGQTIQELAL